MDIKMTFGDKIAETAFGFFINGVLDRFRIDEKIVKDQLRDGLSRARARLSSAYSWAYQV